MELHEIGFNFNTFVLAAVCVTFALMVKAVLPDAWAFLTDPEARTLFREGANGAGGMSVREARMKGLLPPKR